MWAIAEFTSTKHYAVLIWQDTDATTGQPRYAVRAYSKHQQLSEPARARYHTLTDARRVARFWRDTLRDYELGIIR